MPIKALAIVSDSEQPLKYRYEAIIDYMLANPQLKLGEIADLIGVTQPWLSQIINSDGFQSRYSQRRFTYNNHQEQALSAKLYDMADKASDRVLDELDKGENCDASFALDAATRSLRAIGFGAPPSKGALAVEVTAVASDGVNSETLAIARQAIANQSVVMTRVVERVEVSPSDRSEEGRVFEQSPSVEAHNEIEGEKEEGTGL